MRWYEAVLFSFEPTGMDATRRPIGREVASSTALFRRAPWKAALDETEGNRGFSVRRTYITKSPETAFKGIVSFTAEGERYSLENVAVLGDWVAVTGKRVKVQ